MTVDTLISKLEELDHDLVIKPDHDPDNKCNYKLNKKQLVKCFNNSHIQSYADNIWKKDNTITLNEFIKYMYSTNNKNTKGIYHIYMDYVFALHNIEIKHPLNFSNLSIQDINKVKPQRIEYFFAWWVNNQIQNHTFLNKMKHILQPKYQETMGDYDKRYYDISFPKIKLVIEIQEDNASHKDNDNDKLKQDLAIYNNNQMFYIHEKQYKDASENGKYGHINYLEKIWKEISMYLIQGVLAVGSTIETRQYVKYKFIEIVNMNKNRLQKELTQVQTLANNHIKSNNIKGRLKYYNNLANSNHKFINDIYRWRCDKFNHTIPLDEVITLLQINEEAELENYIVTKLDYQRIDDKIHLTWNSLIKLMLDYEEIDKDVKFTIHEYLSNIEDIYEEIIMHVRTHYEKYANVNDNNIKMAEEYLRTQIETKNQKDMKMLKDKNEELVNKNKVLSDQVKKVITKTNSVYNHFSKIKSIKITKEYKEIIDNLSKMYLKNGSNTLTFQNIKNESIFEELVDFPIKYTGNSKHQVTKIEFINICEINNIKRSIAEDTINKLDTDPFVKSKSIIYGIVNCDLIKNFDDEEETNLNIIQEKIGELSLLEDKTEDNTEDDTEVAEGSL